MAAPKRLNQLAKDLNVGLSIIVDFLAMKGFVIENKPTTILSNEQLNTVLKAFEGLDKYTPSEIDAIKPSLANSSFNSANSSLANSNSFTTLSRIAEIRRIKGVPSTVFKYFGTQDYNLDCLRDKYLYYSAPQDFNDPFDCHTCLISFDDRKMSKYYKNQVDIFKQRVKLIGICCFSRRNDSMLMWSHYSDKHKGYCIEFHNSNKPNRIAPLDVNYLDKFSPASFKSQTEDAIFNLIYTKSTDWSYEQELRQIASNLVAPNARKVKIHEDDIKSIYFGVNCSSDLRNSITAILHEKYSNFKTIKLYQAFIKDNEFKIEFKEVIA